MEQPGTSAHLTGAVQDLASQVVSALRSGDHCAVLGTATGPAGTYDLDTENENDPEFDPRSDITLAAVRVLGADVMLPGVLYGRPPVPEDVAVFEKAVLAFPPAPGASPASRWSHWGMVRALSALDGSAASPAATTPAGGAEPDAGWLAGAPWQVLTHQLAVLASLAVPGTDCAVRRAAQDRPVDVARGFVRAVRRRDWLQAAGAGRWLVLLDGVPATLGLDTGLEFVSHMGGDDPRVALHLQAALLTRGGARV
ncbi:hypothetical protein ACLGI4_26550 [Streptomyces sp. HMX112]|uniref:hypothetical protein n=1 Tax=Streptomyces sp. HMX112 TaxID=3390850 RepID=UPI003A8117D0